MQLIRGLHNSQPYLSGCALTIGNFDGVHLGHQAILRHLRQKANALNLPMAVSRNRVNILWATKRPRA